MLVESIEEFAKILPKNGRLLGIDHGQKTIGFAISDYDRTIATPYDTVRRHQRFAADLDHIASKVLDGVCCGMVIGYPLNMDGSEGSRCQSVRALVRNLEPSIDLPMLLWDERLSSHCANDAMLRSGLNPQQREEKVDKVAAAIILQGALDKMAKLR